MTVNGDSVSVTYTKLAGAIGQKVAESDNNFPGSKNDERTTKNDPSNRCEEGHSGDENELISTWLTT
jgi:hypothetical protein